MSGDYLRIDLPKGIRTDIRDWDDREYRQQVEYYNVLARQNEEIHRKKMEKHRQWVALAAEIFGVRSREHRYALEHFPPILPSVTKVLKKLDGLWQQEYYRRQDRRKREDYRERSRRAREALERNGFVEGVDFEASKAITYAKKLLVEIAPGEYTARIPDLSTGFSPEEEA